MDITKLTNELTFSRLERHKMAINPILSARLEFFSKNCGAHVQGHLAFFSTNSADFAIHHY